MKKILIALVSLLVLALAAFYLFIPGKIKMEVTVSLKAALPGVSRFLTDNNNWNKWWPVNTPLIYHKQTYSIRGKIFNAFDISIQNGNDTMNSRMELVLVNADTMIINWHGEKQSSINPFHRFADHQDAKATEKNMKELLGTLKAYIEKTANIYGITVVETKVVDSVLIATRRSFDKKPSVQDIDAMIQSLKKYIVQNHAVEKNFPMLNILKIDSSHYEVMTAIPVDRELPGTTEFAPRYLLKGGNILETQIQGGPTTIEKSFAEFENYYSDHQYTSPAIPYQLLVTDRAKEPDTTKWITKFYYPVF